MLTLQHRGSKMPIALLAVLGVDSIAFVLSRKLHIAVSVKHDWATVS